MFYLALLLHAVLVQGQGAPAGLTPTGAAPAGCVSSGVGSYEVIIVKPIAAAKRDLEELITCSTNALVVQLNNGVLTDSKGRIGSIVASRQFEFVGPPAATDTIFDAGFSFCPNTSIALGSTTNLFQCLSGNFFNLYDQPSESNCTLVNLEVTPCITASSSANSTVSNTDTSSSSDISTTSPSTSDPATGSTSSSIISPAGTPILTDTVTGPLGSSSSSSSTTYTASMNSITSSISGNGTNSTPVSPMLSDPAKIGVGVGSGIAAVLIFGLAAFVFGHRQGKMRIANVNEPGVAVDNEPGVAIDDDPGAAIADKPGIVVN